MLAQLQIACQIASTASTCTLSFFLFLTTPTQPPQLACFGQPPPSLPNFARKGGSLRAFVPHLLALRLPFSLGEGPPVFASLTFGASHLLSMSAEPLSISSELSAGVDSERLAAMLFIKKALPFCVLTQGLGEDVRKPQCLRGDMGRITTLCHGSIAPLNPRLA